LLKINLNTSSLFHHVRFNKEKNLCVAKDHICKSLAQSAFAIVAFLLTKNKVDFTSFE